jgi:hypothetical protein
MHYRNRVFSMYQYLLVRTEYRPVQKMYIGTDQYIPVHTEYVPKIMSCILDTNRGTDSVLEHHSIHVKHI